MKNYAAHLRVLLVVVFGLMLSSCGREPDVQTELFPQKLSDRLELRSGEKTRHVLYDKDNVTKLRAIVDYTDGKSAEITYRRSGEGAGAIERAKIFYAQPDLTKPKQLSREIEIDVDGRTFIADAVYGENGVLQRRAQMVGDLYEVRDLRENGTTVAKFTQYTKEDDVWKATLVHEFYPDASLFKEIRLLENGSLETKEFGEDRLLKKVVTIDRWKSELVTELYEPDGSTVASRTTESYSDIIVETFSNGALVESREFAYRYLHNAPFRMTVTVYSGKDTPLYRQRYILTDESQIWAGRSGAASFAVNELMFRLESVEVLVPNGDYEPEASKIFTMDKDGKRPVSVVIPDEPGWFIPHTEKTFYPDGSVNRIRHMKYGGVVDRTEEHAPEENIREPLDEESLKSRPFESPQRTLRSDEETDG